MTVQEVQKMTLGFISIKSMASFRLYMFTCLAAIVLHLYISFFFFFTDLDDLLVHSMFLYADNVYRSGLCITSRNMAVISQSLPRQWSLLILTFPSNALLFQRAIMTLTIFLHSRYIHLHSLEYIVLTLMPIYTNFLASLFPKSTFIFFFYNFVFQESVSCI